MSTAIALFGSSRRNGNTGRLMDDVADRLAIEVIDLSEAEISPYDYNHRNRGDAFEPLIERMLHHDQVIFASPVYWYAVSAPMKVFLDRISDLLDIPELQESRRLLKTKCAYVLCTSIYEEVPKPFIAAFQMTFDYLGVRFGGCLHANCENGYAALSYESDIVDFVARIRSYRAQTRDPH